MPLIGALAGVGAVTLFFAGVLFLALPLIGFLYGIYGKSATGTMGRLKFLLMLILFVIVNFVSMILFVVVVAVTAGLATILFPFVLAVFFFWFARILTQRVNDFNGNKNLVLALGIMWALIIPLAITIVLFPVSIILWVVCSVIALYLLLKPGVN